jgi:hypothetical protein
MERIAFAYLMSYLGYKCQGGFDRGEVETIDQIITEGLPKHDTITGYNDSLLSDMLAAMKSGRKIEAIRYYRALSGFGLKESKDFVEQHWITQHVDKID